MAETVAFCSDLLHGSTPRWLSFLGPSGVGKTMLAKQAVRCIREASRNSVWRVYTSRGRDRAGFAIPQIAIVRPLVDLDTYKAAAEWGEFDLLFVEDIGAGRETERGSGKIIRDRLAELLHMRTGKWTILDSNLRFEDVQDHLDGRIASRLTRDGSTVIIFDPDTPDYQYRTTTPQ